MILALRVIFIIIHMNIFGNARPLPIRHAHRWYDCLSQLGWIRDGQYVTNKNQKLEIVENGGVLEINMKNHGGTLMKTVTIRREGCYVKTVQCKLDDEDCVSGMVHKWRPSAWLLVPESRKCPIKNQGALAYENRTGAAGEKTWRKELAKRAPAGAKCFLKRAKNTKDPKPCGTEENGELLSLKEISRQSAEYSELQVDNEADLILARGDGEFYWNKLQLNEYFVCKKHFKSLGREWNKKRPVIERKKIKVGLKCMMPIIDGAVSHAAPSKANRYITKEESEALLIVRHVFVPLGTAVCQPHKEFAGDVVAEYRVVRKGYNFRDIVPVSLAEAPLTPRALPKYVQYQKELDQQLCLPFEKTSEDEKDDPDTSAAAEYSKEISQESMKQHILGIAQEANIDPASIHSTNDFRILASSTQRKRIQVARRIIFPICEFFAPDDPKYFEQLLYGKQELSFANAKVQAKLEQVMARTLDCFRNAPTAIAKQQILSLVAPFFELSEIQAYFPGLSPYYFKRARVFAKLYQPGQVPPKPDTTRQRITDKQLAIVIQFITSPPVVMDLPFGTSTVTSTAGVKEDIPRVVRMQVNERIYQQYSAYMKETNQQELAVSRSTMLRILEYCTATTRKSLQGLDYFTWAGGEGFSTLIKISETLASISGDQEWSTEVINWLKDARQYLKMDYRMHIKSNSRIPDHCLIYALSDPKNSAFAEPIEHSIDLRCDRCEFLATAMEEIREQLDNTDFSTDFEKQELIYDYENSVNSILEMKKHIMRTLRQDQARTEILNGLQQNEVYIQADWAMKVLPISGRVPQSEWFGQRGTSWHITHVMARDQTSQSYRTRLYIHVFDSVAQDSPAVIAILNSVLQRIKQELPHITHAYLRSDNAGCYHSAQTIAAIPEISSNAKIIIKRWDFSDPQSGKGACDRAAAIVKNHVRLYAAENHKCTNAREFIDCANSYNGIRSVTMLHVDVEIQKRKLPKIAGISQYYNFEFQRLENQKNSDIVVWKAYKIGTGLTLPRKNWRNHQLLRKMTYQAVFSEGNEDTGVADDRYWKLIHESIPVRGRDLGASSCSDTGTDGSEQESNEDLASIEKLMFPCPETGCIKTYQSQCGLDKHIEQGNHNYQPEKVSLRDAAIGAYKKELEGLRFPQSLPSINTAMESLLESGNVITPGIPKGWALRVRKACTSFSEKQRTYLTSKFDKGEKTGRKLDPKVLAKEMRKEFPKEEWLAWAQIASYWSRLARSRRKEATPDTDEELDENGAKLQGEEAICEENIEDDPHFNTLEDDIYDSLEENAGNIFA